MFSQESPLVESCHRAPEETQGGIPSSTSKQTNRVLSRSLVPAWFIPRPKTLVEQGFSIKETSLHIDYSTQFEHKLPNSKVWSKGIFIRNVSPFDKCGHPPSTPSSSLGRKESVISRAFQYWACQWTYEQPLPPFRNFYCTGSLDNPYTVHRSSVKNWQLERQITKERSTFRFWRRGSQQVDPQPELRNSWHKWLQHRRQLVGEVLRLIRSLQVFISWNHTSNHHKISVYYLLWCNDIITAA